MSRHLKHKFRPVTFKSVVKYFARQSWSERLSMIIATMTLLALATPFCTFAQPDVTEKDGTTQRVVKTVLGWELATVGGNKLGVWQWVDASGQAHPTNPFSMVTSPVPFSTWHAFLPITTCLAMFAVVLNLVMIWHLVCRAIENTDVFDDILIPALCTTVCSGSIGLVQGILLGLGSVAGGGLSVTKYDMEGASEAWDQVKKEGRAEVDVGTALIVGWSSLGGCILWYVIVKKRHSVTLAEFVDKCEAKWGRKKQDGSESDIEKGSENKKDKGE